MGHATFEQVPKSLADALKKADRAMYAAKSSGKGRVVSFSRLASPPQHLTACEILSGANRSFRIWDVSLGHLTRRERSA